MLRAATNDVELAELEMAAFGVSHDALGAALCDSWGVHAGAVVSVRHHVTAQATQTLPAVERRGILALSVIAHAMAEEPDAIDERTAHVAAQCDIDSQGLVRAARRVQEQLAEAAARGR
jgi:hypothetical protein